MSPQEAAEVAAVIGAGFHDGPCLRCLAAAACDLDKRLPGPNWYALVAGAAASFSKEAAHWSEALLREASPCQPDEDTGPL